MQRGLGGSVFEPVQEPIQPRRDREVTIGPLMLITLGLGMFALCAFCFLFGYSVGHRSAAESPGVGAAPASEAPALTQPASQQMKPSAGEGGGVQPHQPAAAVTQADSPATDSTAALAQATPDPAPVTDSVPAGAKAGTASPPTKEPEARAALATQATDSRHPSDGQAAVQPPLAKLPGIMVQIAVVSQPEDADVLVSALRKRGYAVTSRRDPADGLLHVQVGPFADRNDAIAMRQRLLNDGYNAFLQ